MTISGTYCTVLARFGFLLAAGADQGIRREIYADIRRPYEAFGLFAMEYMLHPVGPSSEGGYLERGRWGNES